jgi:membrane-anchored protein YejM (alkaline phosphatase superfamily)
MTWLGVNEGHHTLSHEPDEKKEVQEQLTRINTWYCAELAYLVKRLSETKEPGTNQTLLDNTVVIWTNELGKGNSHTRDNIPFVLVGNGLDFTMGRSVFYPMVPHNRLLMSLAHAFGNQLTTFGNPTFCSDGVLNRLT